MASDVLKVGHHGSNSSSSPSFLSLVKPSVAVISVGTGNKYGHPAQETLDKLNTIGANTYRTDKDGTIAITTDGKFISVRAGLIGNVTDPGSNTNSAVSPQNTVTNTSTPAITQGQYVGSKESNKYHLPSCRYAEKIEVSNQVWFKDKAAALAAGYHSCGVCCGN